MGSYGFEDSTSRRTAKLHDGFKSYIDISDVLSMIILGFFWIWNMSTVDNGGVSMGRSVAVSVSDTIFF